MKKLMMGLVLAFITGANLSSAHADTPRTWIRGTNNVYLTKECYSGTHRITGKYQGRAVAYVGIIDCINPTVGSIRVLPLRPGYFAKQAWGPLYRFWYQTPYGGRVVASVR